MSVFVSLNVVYVLLAVAVQFQETTYRVTEGKTTRLIVTLEASMDHDFEFVVNVRISDGTAERMLILWRSFF